MKWLLKQDKKHYHLIQTTIKKIAVLGPQADKVELGDYSGNVEPSLESSPLSGIQNYIKEKGLNIEVVHAAGGNTERKNDFFTLNSFSTVGKDGTVKDYDATKFDNSAKGLITEPRFGRVSIRGIKNGDWTSYGNINVGELDSIRFKLNVTYDGGTIEARVGSATGNIIASQKVVSGGQRWWWVFWQCGNRICKSEYTGHHWPAGCLYGFQRTRSAGNR